MIIDKNPIIDVLNSTIQVTNNIDTNEDVLIMVNGMIAITNDDITSINNNIITISQNTGVDLDIDVIAVIYDSL